MSDTAGEQHDKVDYIPGAVFSEELIATIKHLRAAYDVDVKNHSHSLAMAQRFRTWENRVRRTHLLYKTITNTTEDPHVRQVLTKVLQICVGGLIFDFIEFFDRTTYAPDQVLMKGMEEVIVTSKNNVERGIFDRIVDHINEDAGPDIPS